MRHIYTSIVSRHLATRGNNKILFTPPPHISSSEEILPRLTFAKLRQNNSPFLKSYLHKVDAKSHPSPLCPFCNTHIHNISSTAPKYATRFHLWICGHTPPKCVCTAGQMDREAGWSSSEEIGFPPLEMVMGVSRQQHSRTLVIRRNYKLAMIKY